MALVIDLKPNEKVLVGNTIITNDKQKTRLRIDGDAPILREKDTMTEEAAITPSKKLYLIIQNMYLAPMDKAMNGFDEYFIQLEQIRTIASHVNSILCQISAQVLQGYYYKALKQVQDLITLEENGNASLPQNQEKEENGSFNPSKMEAQLLIQSADQLDNLMVKWSEHSDEDITNIISYNRKLWMVFFDDMNNKKESKEIKNPEEFNIQNNIINLYNFIYKRSLDIVETKNKEKIRTLIDINKATAEALLS